MYLDQGIPKGGNYIRSITALVLWTLRVDTRSKGGVGCVYVVWERGSRAKVCGKSAPGQVRMYTWEGYRQHTGPEFTAGERASLAVPKKATGRVLDGRADRNGAGA